MALKYYSYVSCYGVNSINELRGAVFVNQVPRQLINARPNTDMPKPNIFASAKTYFHRARPVLSEIKYLNSGLKIMEAMAVLRAVSSTVVCFDDLERRSKGLTANEIFGLASYLKEDRKCKVILIFNDDAEKSDQEEIDTLREKTVDKWITFSPTPLEACDIAIPEHDREYGTITWAAVQLRISNIRMITRIARHAREITPLLHDINNQVRAHCINTLALAVWAIYGGTETPTLD
jgi:hypothetical protein